jgi:glycosyltransferase involved in cell wall biosynthesis
MKLLMLMRDALPPTRVDVAVLFDRALRELGLSTDFAGPGPDAVLPSSARCFDTGPRQRLASAWRLAHLAWREAQRHDIVIARDLPLASAAIALACAARRRPLVVWMSFPMPLGDRLAAQRHRAEGRRARALVVGARGSLAQWVQDCLVLPRAAHVFVQSDAMREDLLARVPGLARERVTAVPMGIDPAALPARAEGGATGRIDPAAHPREGYGLVYLGSLDPARRLDVLIEALVLLCERGWTVRLSLIGPAPRPEDLLALKAVARRAGVADRVEFTGPLPMAQAWDRVAAADVALAAVPPGPLHDVSSPTKVVEYLALGVPVVASRIPDQASLLAACGGGECADFDAASFAAAIERVLRAGPAARAAAIDARERVLALRAYPLLAQQVAAVLRGLPRPRASRLQGVAA